MIWAAQLCIWGIIHEINTCTVLRRAHISMQKMLALLFIITQKVYYLLCVAPEMLTLTSPHLCSFRAYNLQTVGGKKTLKLSKFKECYIQSALKACLFCLLGLSFSRLPLPQSWSRLPSPLTRMAPTAPSFPCLQPCSSPHNATRGIV